MSSLKFLSRKLNKTQNMFALSITVIGDFSIKRFYHRVPCGINIHTLVGCDFKLKIGEFLPQRTLWY